MAEAIDETAIIAWIDGELDPARAATVARAIEGDAALAALADRHRHMKARFAAAFDQLADQAEAGTPAAPVVSLAAARAAREARANAPHRWVLPGAIAASLVVGVLAGRGWRPAPRIGDRPDALALAPSIDNALDQQLSGERGAVHIALSFREHDGRYCRSFDAERLSGIACRGHSGWRLRYGAPEGASVSDYRMAGDDPQRMAAVGVLIAGDPLDRAAEQQARARGWK